MKKLFMVTLLVAQATFMVIGDANSSGVAQSSVMSTNDTDMQITYYNKKGKKISSETLYGYRSSSALAKSFIPSNTDKITVTMTATLNNPTTTGMSYYVQADNNNNLIISPASTGASTSSTGESNIVAAPTIPA